MRLSYLIMGLAALALPAAAAAQNNTPPTQTLGSYNDRSGQSRPLSGVVLQNPDGTLASAGGGGTPTGTAGTPNSSVVTVQGIAGGVAAPTSVANGLDIAEGNTGDTAWTGTGACTVISCLKYIGTGPTASGSNTIGRVAQVTDALVTGASTPVATAAVAGGQVLKASSGNLFGLNVVSGGTAGYVLVTNTTTVPADGAVTPLKCYVIPANASLDVNLRATPVFFSTGISVSFSTTGCFAKTASATAFISGDIK